MTTKLKAGDTVRLKGNQSNPVMTVGDIEEQSSGRIVISVDWFEDGKRQQGSFDGDQLEIVS